MLCHESVVLSSVFSMFSPLARGTAYSDGGIRLEKDFENQYIEDQLLPQLFLKSNNQASRSCSFDSASNGQILLPKTFVTRKGALLLFTPSEELLIDDDDVPKKPPNVYDDGLKLGTVGNLASSVLEFGKEEERAWEGVPSTPTNQGPHPITDRKNFLRFLHYLDSQCLTADKYAQPGCDPDFYLEELRNKSGAQGSQRRFGANTPYSTRTYSSFLEDDDMSDIVREYVRYSRLHAEPSTTTHDDQRKEYDDDAQDAEYDEYPAGKTQSRYPHRSVSLTPSHGHHGKANQSWRQEFYVHDDSGHGHHGNDDSFRPRTAPLPPAPESPRANPRITSGRAPPKRPLGSTPDNLDGILHADVGLGRYQRKGPPPRLKFSRNSSPALFPASSMCENSSLSFYPASSRGGSPDYDVMPRYETPGARSEDWGRAADVIKEVDEYSQVSSRRDTSRPVSAVSCISHPSSHGKQTSRRDSYDGGEEDARMRCDVSAVSGSLSSVSGHPQSISGKSYARSFSRGSRDLSEVTSKRPNSAILSKGEREPRARVKSAPSDSQHKQPSILTRPSSAAQRETRTVGSPSPSTKTEISDSRRAWPAPAQYYADSRCVSWTQDSKPPSSACSAVSHQTVRAQSGSQKSQRKQSAVASRANSQSSLAEGAGDPSAFQAVAGDVDGTLATLGSEVDMYDVEFHPRDQPLEESGSDLADEDWDNKADAYWPKEVAERLEESGDEAGYGSAAEEVAIDLPATPSLAGSGFFQLNAHWTPVPADDSLEEPVRVPSETGATGFQSRSPSPTRLLVPGPAPDADAEDDDSVLSADIAINWPPNTPSSPPPLTQEPKMPADSLQVTGARPMSSLSIYQENIEIEKSRPQSPLTEEEKQKPVSVGEAVERYLETGREPQIRSRSARSRRTSETGDEVNVEEPSKPAKQLKNLYPKPAAPEIQVNQLKESASKKTDSAPSKTKTGVEKTQENIEPYKVSKDVPKMAEITDPFENKLKNESRDAMSLNLGRSPPKPSQRTDAESEKRREYVNSLLIKSEPQVARGHLELERVGKEGGVTSEAASVSIMSRPAEQSGKKEVKKNDLSDLASLVSRNKPSAKEKEKKDTKKKKTQKSAKKKEITVDPNNIDLHVFTSPDMIEHMDDELKAFIQQEKGLVPDAGQTSESAAVQTMEMAQVAPKVAPAKKDAYSPSKPKKPTKQELAKKRADARKAEKKRKEQEKKRKEEEKRIRDEELRLLKEREEEQALARAQAEAKQQAIEEEKAKRLQDEDQARREEEQAQEKLKDAKRKAREERESRRAAEAERRRLEVQKKREEKKKREEEMREKEKEMEQNKIDQEKRKQELMESRRFQRQARSQGGFGGSEELPHST
ncbi:microtubule-associated protein futsch isoform X3 [Nematostella vectensis]|uniref:microtubule-associated protein futsch isoform X3 n=1 Tax=Nematostella vectensis TaxID=45351 RepID=UPI0020772EC5|nr:microtubule-associated protein futsch isoform X3 [Nematostella vectensis]